MDTAAASPPDLTGSRSSKSSSYPSSFDHEGIITDDSHFEDIGLHDEQDAGDIAFSPYLTQSSSNAIGQRMWTGRGHQQTASMDSWRDLTAPKRPRYPSLKEQVNGVVNDGRNGLSTELRPRERRPSPSVPSLASRLSVQYLSRPRSSSPSKSPRHTRSPMSLSGAASTPSQGFYGVPPKRRGSWQPNRKTVQELEDECRDSDEEVPIDAVFWNVPISPRLIQERATSFTSSRKTSPSTSPDRKGRSLAQSDIKPTSTYSSSPLNIRPSAEPINGSAVSTSALPTRSPSGLSARQYQFQNARSATWTAALSDLSEETRCLTKALEAHADREKERDEGKVQRGLRGRGWKQEQPKRHPSASLIELPSIRKGNIMIDPLPISREKEAVLSRTRPSWLPPKNQEEEKRHLKEYQKMVAHSLESDRKKAEREERSRRLRDDTKTSLSRIWDQHVLPNWDRVILQPRTRELWWRGIAPRSRGVVWQKAVGNELGLTEKSYKAALRRAKDAERELQGEEDEEKESTYVVRDRGVRRRRRERDWFQAIRRDAKTTFPELRIFQPDGPLHDPLIDVLMAYSMYRSDVGYIYGTHLITALLLLNLPAAPAFLVLSNLLNRSVPLSFLTSDTSVISHTYALTQRALAYKFPHVHRTLAHMPPAVYLEPMFRTLFTHSLPLDHVSRVWDVYVFEGDKLLIRTAVALLGSLQGRLWFGGDGGGGGRKGGEEEVRLEKEVGRRIGWECRAPPWAYAGLDVDEEEFMSAVREAGKEEE
ncbi:MAG: hypothetical protein M1816_001959 [Peltula sp. TS41687]|nr:MAG: hypothetical protein M1816_001959 [Peltula sp. TS41687]